MFFPTNRGVHICSSIKRPTADRHLPGHHGVDDQLLGGRGVDFPGKHISRDKLAGDKPATRWAKNGAPTLNGRKYMGNWGEKKPTYRGPITPFITMELLGGPQDLVQWLMTMVIVGTSLKDRARWDPKTIHGLL